MDKKFFLVRLDDGPDGVHIKIDYIEAQTPHVDQRYFRARKHLLETGEEEDQKIDPYGTVIKVFTEGDNRNLNLLVELTGDKGFDILHALVDACLSQREYA